jgi:putative ABC transport system permease protein
MKTTWRNLWKNKFYTSINIIGLAIGLAVSILIMLWVQDELSFDRFHKNHAQLYQVLENQKYGTGEVYTFSSTPAPLAQVLKKDFPDIMYASRVSWGNEHLFNYGEKHIDEFGLYVDPDFLKMFSFPLTLGDPNKVLIEPNTLLISETLASKYFGLENPVGKMIRVDEDRQYKVEGVFKDAPSNSTLEFSFLMPVADYIKLYMNNEERWDNNNIQAFVQLRKESDPNVVTAKISDLLPKKHADQVNVKLFLSPAADWYLRSSFKDGKNTGGRIAYVNLFIVVAIFILLIACINFTNLATAQATKRSKEVGVRKVIGANKVSLVRQFLGESLMLSFFAGLLSILFVLPVLPWINQLLQRKLNIDFSNLSYLFVFIGIILIAGLLSGIYPALVLSSFQPIKVLKGVTAGIKGKSYLLRKSLVIIQFVISVVMIIGTIIIYQQIKYFQSKNLGYKTENLIYFSSAGVPEQQYESFKNELAGVQGVKGVTRSSINFTGSNNSTSNVKWNGKLNEKEVLFSLINTDYDLLNTFGIELKEGRNFSKGFGADTSNYIINEEAVRRMNLKGPVVGQPLELSERKGTIIGVAKDFHFSSMHGPIEPVIIRARDWTWTYYLRIDGQNTASILKNIEAVYKKRIPERPFSFKFMDQEYESMYKSEMQIGELAKWFSILAIFISCLGLFGLVSLTAIQRTKEIGIRKVLGASVTNLLGLLSKDFLILVLIAACIAFPFAWWLMNTWLQDFSYHINIQWWVFLLSGCAVVLIALITVSFQAVKTAMSNPVKSLRME